MEWLDNFKRLFESGGKYSIADVSRLFTLAYDQQAELAREAEAAEVAYSKIHKLEAELAEFRNGLAKTCLGTPERQHQTITHMSYQHCELCRARAELAALKAENERLNKLFYLSEPEGKIILRQSNEIERLREQLVSLQSSLDSATRLYAAAMNLRR